MFIMSPCALNVISHRTTMTVMYLCALNVISQCTTMPLSRICVLNVTQQSMSYIWLQKKIYRLLSRWSPLWGKSEGIYITIPACRKWSSKASRLWAWDQHGSHRVCTLHTPVFQVGHGIVLACTSNNTVKNGFFKNFLILHIQNLT
jgi:hypothetical protein